VIRILKFILYVPIQIVFLPLAIVGILDGVYREMVKSRKLGVSFSAIMALQYRWLMHYLDARPDPLSVAFTRKFPCESHLGLLATFGALILSRRWFGLTTRFGTVDPPGEETLVTTPGRRVLMFDEIMRRYVDQVDQVVLPGVGFDLVALHFTRDAGVRVFELDQRRTLEVKVETLERAGIAHDWITFVPVDYASESWVERLEAAGFDRTKKTLFLWQSVSHFLEADRVRETLRSMADLCIDGSVVAQDFYSRAFVAGEISKSAKRSADMMGKRGEPWKFGIEMASEPQEAVESFLER